MDPETQAVVKQLLEENVVTKAEAKEAKQIAKELKDEKILKEYVESRPKISPIWQLSPSSSVLC